MNLVTHVTFVDVSGMPMILHTGTSWGYGALLTLVPDLGIGIYTSITGPDDGYVGRRLTHMYIMDLLMGESPWLNLTTACTFPEPWAPVHKRKPYTFPQGDPNKVPLEFERYVGTFGNFGYGNLSIVLNETSGLLELHYGELGLWDLVVIDDLTFAGKGKGYTWARDIKSILFESLSYSNQLNKVTISFESKDPPVFQRDLKMSEAPLPPDPNQCAAWPQVVDYIFTSAAKSSIANVVLFLFCICIYFV